MADRPPPPEDGPMADRPPPKLRPPKSAPPPMALRPLKARSLKSAPPMAPRPLKERSPIDGRLMPPMERSMPPGRDMARSMSMELRAPRPSNPPRTAGLLRRKSPLAVPRLTMLPVGTRIEVRAVVASARPTPLAVGLTRRAAFCESSTCRAGCTRLFEFAPRAFRPAVRCRSLPARPGLPTRPATASRPATALRGAALTRLRPAAVPANVFRGFKPTERAAKLL